MIAPAMPAAWAVAGLVAQKVVRGCVRNSLFVVKRESEPTPDSSSVSARLIARLPASKTISGLIGVREWSQSVDIRLYGLRSPTSATPFQPSRLSVAAISTLSVNPPTAIAFHACAGSSTGNSSGSETSSGSEASGMLPAETKNRRRGSSPPSSGASPGIAPAQA
jgi:hypothetical protein